MLAPAPLVVVRALFAPILHSASSCPCPVHFLSTLRLPCRAGSLGQRTLSLLHSLLFPLALKPFLLLFCLFLPLVFELLASHPTSCTNTKKLGKMTAYVSVVIKYNTQKAALRIRYQGSVRKMDVDVATSRKT